MNHTFVHETILPELRMKKEKHFDASENIQADNNFKCLTVMPSFR